MRDREVSEGGLVRSDVERLVTIETMLKDVISRLTSLNQDMNADSKLLVQLQQDVHRINYDLAAERQARIDLAARMALLDGDMRKGLGEIRQAVDQNTSFRRDLLVGAGAGGTVVAALAAAGAWLMGLGPAILAWLRGAP